MVCIHHTAADVLTGRGPAIGRFLREIIGTAGSIECGLCVACCGGGPVLLDRSLLLPADHQVDVL